VLSLRLERELRDDARAGHVRRPLRIPTTVAEQVGYAYPVTKHLDEGRAWVTELLTKNGASVAA